MKTLPSLCFTFSFLLVAATSFAQTSVQSEQPITVGESIENSLSAGSVHTYPLELEEEQFVHGFVIQESVDAVVTIYSPTGEKAAEFDASAVGRDSFQFNTKNAGTYRIEIKPFKEDEGEYSIRVDVVEPIATEPAARINQMMVEYTGDDVPGAAVLVMKDGEVIFQESYGMANLTYDVSMTENTLHNIGSTSKHFLALGLLLLQEEGKLSLDDDVREYIPELPEFEHTVTLRNLITHTSGYREFINLMVMTGRNISSNLDIDKIIDIVQRQPELQNIPGSEFNYNNTGYALMTEVIKRVTDTPFDEWMKNNLFDPLGMHNTVVRTRSDQIVTNRSTGYSYGNNGYEEVTDLGGAAGAGGIHITLDDFAKWIQNMNNPEVGSPEMIEKMTTPYELNNGKSTGYGLGLFIQDYKGLKQIHHGGGDMAHRSMFMLFPEIDAAIVTQSNLASFNGAIPNRIADLFFGEYMERDEDSEQEETLASDDETEFEYDPQNFDLLAGRYELSIMPGFILTFDREGDRIYTQATNQPEVDLTATSDSTFSLMGVNASVTFHLNEDATADSLTLHQNGNHIAKKIDFTLAPDEMSEYTGRFYSDEIETTYTIELKDDELVMQHFQLEEEMILDPTHKDQFGSVMPIQTVEFVRNDEGEITGFNASNGRTRDVFFRKVE
ncbi:serine hydrolase domain-containing protein [Rhodohalobacter sp.]|uniref:serine hydrolase domain-containing protein n=1 Tax=Rhodohalobacter sp. TaxID=1974210 RepID=UPI00356295EF